MPDFLSGLALTKLMLHGNNITGSLSPEPLAASCSLAHLNVGGNRLTALPPGHHLESLVVLNLLHSGLKTLPPAVHAARATLRELFLSYSKDLVLSPADADFLAVSERAAWCDAEYVPARPSTLPL